MLPAAGVAKLRDVTKSTFDKHVDDENRLGGWDIINQIINTWICPQIGPNLDVNLTSLSQQQCVSCLRSEALIHRNLIDKFPLDRELGRRR